MTKETEKKKRAPAKKSPLQIVKDRYGDKKKLVSILAGKLERRKGESRGAFEKRLQKAPSKKLLRMFERFEEADGLGGRTALIDAIHDHQARRITRKEDFKEDKGFKEHLNKKTLGKLLDMHRTIQKQKRRELR